MLGFTNKRNPVICHEIGPIGPRIRTFNNTLILEFEDTSSSMTKIFVNLALRKQSQSNQKSYFYYFVAYRKEAYRLKNTEVINFSILDPFIKHVFLDKTCLLIWCERQFVDFQLNTLIKILFKIQIAVKKRQLL